MLLMIRLANVSRRAFLSYAIAYAVIFVGCLEAVNAIVFYGVSPRAIVSGHPVAHLAQRLRAASSAEHPDRAMLSKLDQYPRLALPFASFGDPAVERYVITRGKLDPEYFVGTVGVYNAHALERKLQDLSKAEYLLVPRRLVSTKSPPDPCAGHLKGLRQWFLYPAKLPCRANPLDPTTAVQSFIAEHYTPVEEVGSWVVLRRAGGAPG